MIHNSTAFTPADYAGAAFSLPALSLVIAILVAGGMLLALSRPRAARGATSISDAVAHAVRARYLPEQRSLRFAALGVIALFLIENVFRGYVWHASDDVSWWRYATPLAAALVGLIVTLGLIATRGSTRPEAPTLPAGRRTWRSFSSRASLAGTCAVFIVLMLTTVLAGLTSSPNSRGQYVWLEIFILNEPEIDAVRPRFFGWTYGIPVLVCLVALAIVAWAVLDRNAARPFIRPESFAPERAARRAVASASEHILTAAVLLGLAGAWRLIASAGSVASLAIGGQNGGEPYEVAWRYAELATAAGWCAPVLEIIAFTLLIVVAFRPQPSRLARSADPAVPATPAAVSL